MNYNIIGYSSYIIIIAYITIFIGKRFHSNGRVFIHELFTDYKLGESVNNILLVAYYLLNIGNAILVIRSWPQLFNLAAVVEQVSINTGQIILFLALMHYINIGLLMIGRKKLNKV